MSKWIYISPKSVTSAAVKVCMNRRLDYKDFSLKYVNGRCILCWRMLQVWCSRVFSMAPHSPGVYHHFLHSNCHFEHEKFWAIPFCASLQRLWPTATTSVREREHGYLDFLEFASNPPWGGRYYSEEKIELCHMCWIVVLARHSDIFQAGYGSHRQTITGSFMKGVPVVRPARSRDIPAMGCTIWVCFFAINSGISSFTVQSFACSVVNAVTYRLGNGLYRVYSLYPLVN